jgi:peptidoglycan DL-endopeptidase LytE
MDSRFPGGFPGDAKKGVKNVAKGIDLFYNVAAFKKSLHAPRKNSPEMIQTENLGKRFFLLFFLISLFIASPAAWADMTHIVKKGESLSSIAQKYQVSVFIIKDANGLENTCLQIGQSLTIPKPSPANSTLSSARKAPVRDAVPGTEIPDMHMVKSGDTLAKIAKRYHLSVKELRELNELKGSTLKVGQVLQLKGEEDISEEPETQTGGGSFESALRANDGSGIPISQGADMMEEQDLNPLVTVAESFLGVKYRRGGSSLKTGFDCSAYVQKVFRVVGVDLPRTAREQFGVGMEVARDALRLGDLVFFKHSKTKRPAHVGIYIGNDQFIHSSTTKKKIKVDSLTTRYFSTRFIGGRRIQEVKTQPDLPPSERDYSQISNLALEPSLSLPLLSGASQSSPSFFPDL